MEEPPSYHSILVVNRTGLTLELSLVEAAVKLCLEIGQADPSEVRVLITSDEHVAELNRRFRGFDEATDVLTFLDEESCSGDIAIAAPFADRQAALRGIPLSEELVLLAIHGTLHLLGLDDETEEGRSEMIARMNQVAERLEVETQGDWGSLLHEEILR